MKNDALRHLLLLRGEHIALEVPAHASLVREVVDSLSVTPQGKGVFVVGYTFLGERSSLLTEPGAFIFYRRGDLARPSAELTQAVDVRDLNWDAARRIWEQVLSVSLPRSTPQKLLERASPDIGSSAHLQIALSSIAVLVAPLTFSVLMRRSGLSGRSFPPPQELKRLQFRGLSAFQNGPGNFGVLRAGVNLFRTALGATALAQFLRELESEPSSKRGWRLFSSSLLSVLIGYLASPFRPVHFLISAANFAFGSFARRRTIALESASHILLAAFGGQFSRRGVAQPSGFKPTLGHFALSAVLFAESISQLLHGTRRQLSGFTWPAAVGLTVLRAPFSQLLRLASLIAIVLSHWHRRVGRPVLHEERMFDHGLEKPSFSIQDHPIQIRTTSEN